MARIVILLLLAAAFCLGAALSYFNWTSVRFSYLAGEIELPLVVLLLLAFAAGIVLVLVLTAARIYAHQREISRLSRHLRGTEAELKNLRNLPIGEAAAEGSRAKSA